MASVAKRPKLDGGSTLAASSDDRLQDFLRWCDTVGLTLSDKVYLSRDGTVAEYGMLAREDIEEGEVIFSIPRTALLSQGTSRVKAVLEEGKDSLESASGWVPLLMALMWEYTSPESHWRPYLSLWPNFKAPDHPMFWSKEERASLLQGTGVPEAVDTDLANIQREYSDIVLPFIRAHSDLWSPEKHTLELYRSLVAFVMAYSFQEPLEEEEEDDEKDPNFPMMVPVADMLNHVANHSANLVYTPDCLKMVSVRRIGTGEEVFNTYGEMANWQLLHMYGFAEPYPGNSHDTADIQMSSVYKAAVQGQSQAEHRLLVEKWSLLCEMEMVGEKGVFIFGRAGSLTVTELYHTLKILCMSAEEFEEFRENEGWEEVEEEEDEDEKMMQALSNEGIPQLPPAWRRLLRAAARLTLDQYRGDLKEDKDLLEAREAYARLGSRERHALQVRYGQKVVLHQLLELTQP
ncbi:N-lysine methyltransferase setd6 isoform X2 [Megalops cyprinoides]|uniref:N-lysine methyltransferase setd6 isoform X2 n=1 Tax=Megalops cyprinoides TaxID=118141 RepID=UPI001865086E|nr:N-lysine methyltransferase setd6 isoform X2 [Megalops cyprinoides]